MGKPWCGRCGTSKTINNDGAAQNELLVARVKRRCQEICSGMLQISIEQSLTLEEIGRTILTGNISRTMARNQHQHSWTIT